MPVQVRCISSCACALLLPYMLNTTDATTAGTAPSNSITRACGTLIPTSLFIRLSRRKPGLHVLCSAAAEVTHIGGARLNAAASNAATSGRKPAWRAYIRPTSGAGAYHSCSAQRSCGTCRGRSAAASAPRQKPLGPRSPSLPAQAVPQCQDSARRVRVLHTSTTLSCCAASGACWGCACAPAARPPALAHERQCSRLTAEHEGGSVCGRLRCSCYMKSAGQRRVLAVLLLRERACLMTHHLRRLPHCIVTGPHESSGACQGTRMRRRLSAPQL